MVVAVALLQHLHGHAEEAGGLPQIGALCIIQVAAVWRSVCGVIRSGPMVGSPAAWTAALKPFFTDCTGLPFHSTTACVATARRR